jgi:hypothetical protein
MISVFMIVFFLFCYDNGHVPVGQLESSVEEELVDDVEKVEKTFSSSCDSHFLQVCFLWLPTFSRKLVTYPHF